MHHGKIFAANNIILGMQLDYELWEKENKELLELWKIEQIEHKLELWEIEQIEQKLERWELEHKEYLGATPARDGLWMSTNKIMNNTKA